MRRTDTCPEALRAAQTGSLYIPAPFERLELPDDRGAMLDRAHRRAWTSPATLAAVFLAVCTLLAIVGVILEGA